MGNSNRLNIDAIQSSLIKVQQNFDKINASLSLQRDPPSDEVIQNLISGYQKIDELCANNINLFEIGNSSLLLELNQIVLYQNSEISSEEKNTQFEPTSQHFYEVKDGGIGELMEWLALHDDINIWKLSAGIFTYILSQPQLYIEGNHRTGSLIMSYVLMRGGKSPFVLSYENAHHFFEPAELIKKRRKHTLDEFLHIPKQTRKFAKLLKDEQSSKYFR